MPKNKVRVPNVIRGGVAIPLGNNFYYMKGRKHSAGGIDIGKDLEVEDDEVIQVGNDEMKVFSSVPFLRGVSPSHLVLNGANPNVVFNAQERFKDVNKINDDGSKKKRNGGKKEIGINQIDAIQNYRRSIDSYERDIRTYESSNKKLKDATGLAGNIYRVLATIDPTGIVGTSDAMARYINGDVGAATASLIGSFPFARLIPRAGRLFNLEQVNNNRAVQSLNRMDLLKEFRKEVNDGLEDAARRTRNYDRRGITYDELGKEKTYMELLNNNNKANNKAEKRNKILNTAQTIMRGGVQVYDMERKNNENENKKKYGDRIKYIKNMLRY